MSAHTDHPYLNNPTPFDTTQENIMPSIKALTTDDFDFQTTFGLTGALTITVTGPDGDKITWQPGPHFTRHIQEMTDENTGGHSKDLLEAVQMMCEQTLVSLLAVLDGSACSAEMFTEVHRTLQETVQRLLMPTIPADMLQQLFGGLGGETTMIPGPDGKPVTAMVIGVPRGDIFGGDNVPEVSVYDAGASGGYL